MTEHPPAFIPRKFRCEQAPNGGWTVYDATTVLSNPVAAFQSFRAMLDWFGTVAVPGPKGDAA